MTTAERRAYNKKYDRERYDAGICRECPQSRLPQSVHCAACLLKRRVKQRTRHGHQPRKPGGVGRPQLIPEGP